MAHLARTLYALARRTCSRGKTADVLAGFELSNACAFTRSNHSNKTVSPLQTVPLWICEVLVTSMGGAGLARHNESQIMQDSRTINT
eukprot:201376-Amphidinium_carterae.1